MANYSNAFGTIKIEANEYSAVEAIRTLMETLKGDGYSTEINSSVEDLDICECEPDNDYKYAAEVTFDGNGRWNYANNIQSMFRWIQEEAPKKDLELLDYIEECDFKITFSYTDRETGCCLFGHYVDYIEHDAYTDLYNYEVHEEQAINYDETIVDYCEYLGFTLEEAVEEFSSKYDLEEDLDDFLEDLRAQEQEIEVYCGMSVDDIIEDTDYIQDLLNDRKEEKII